jgi:hypothetical protein
MLSNLKTILFMLLLNSVPKKWFFTAFELFDL